MVYLNSALLAVSPVAAFCLLLVWKAATTTCSLQGFLGSINFRARMLFFSSWFLISAGFALGLYTAVLRW